MAIYDTDPNTTNRAEPTPQAPDEHLQRKSDGTTAITNKQDASSGAYVSTKDATVKVNNGTVDVIKLGLQTDGSYAFQFSDDSVPRLLMNSTSMKISQDGVDVTTATNNQLIFNSDQNMFKIALSGTASIVVPAGANQTGTATVTHNLGQSPLVFGTVTLTPGLSSEIMQFPGAYYVWDGVSRNVPRLVFEYFATDTNTLTLQIRSDGFASGTFTVKYYILQETAN